MKKIQLWVSGCAALFWAAWGVKATMRQQGDLLPTLLTMCVISFMWWLAILLYANKPNS